MIKVAAYCRVSTDREDQANSFVAQQRFFEDYIKRQPQWELFEVYADEGVTGTSTRKRAAFNRMIRDACNGKFQIIVTKEVSRFSRNILDTIAYTRELKSLGIGVIFMTDGFSTLDPDAELRLSIMGSIAQEESRKTSSRVKWGQTRQMEQGVVFGTSMLGYDVERGKLRINQEGAEVVKLIFQKYGIEKKGTTVIVRELREAGIKTYTGNTNWTASHILKILKNEKYVGDLIQKKTFTPDYLTHAKKYNHGEENLIIHTNHHEPIISRELWNLVQIQIQARQRKLNAVGGCSNRYIFSGKIICAECGARFISRTKKRQDGSVYRCWRCITASREGVEKTEVQGKMIGCDVGKIIRDDLATDMLKYAIQNIDIDFAWMIHLVTNLVVKLKQTSYSSEESSNKLQKHIEQIYKKKARSLDAFLSGTISEQEFAQIKTRYDTELEDLNNRLKKAVDIQSKDEKEPYSNWYQKIEAIITCRDISESFLKALLEYMIIHKDGTVEIKLNKLPTIWFFQLYKTRKK